MLPDEIKNYFKTSKKFLNKDTLLNFHGHNNLGFANSNCMHAIDGGAKIIDTSIMGMGRSAGNAVTEMMIPVLQRKGLISKKVDLITILNLANKIISNLNPKNQYQPESILYGKSYFHSGFRGKLLSFTKKNKISFYNTLNNFSFKKILNVNDDLLKKEILKNKKIKYSCKTKNIKYPPIDVNNKLEFNDILSFKKYLKSEKQRLKSQLVISFCRSKKNNFKIIDKLQNYIIAHFESESEVQDKLILKNFKNVEIFIDEKIYKKTYLKQKNLNKYSEDKIYHEAKNLFLRTKTKYKKFEIFKNSKYKLINKTKNPLIITKTIDNRNIELLKMIKIPFNLLIYENLKIELKKLKINIKNLKKVFRLNYGFILSLEILKLLNSKRFYELNFGKKVLFNKIPIISGGIVGENNSLVVDNVENPSRIIGFADGYGGIKNQKISLDKQILLGKLILDQTNDFPN